MKLVKRTPIDEPIQIIRSLTPEEERSLSSPESVTAQNLLYQAWASHQWFACDCTNSDKPPMMSVRQKNGTYSFVRMTQRAQHHDHCPYRFTEPEKIEKKINEARRVGDYLNFHRIAPDLTDTPVQSLSSKSKPSELTQLGRFAITLLERSKANLILPYKTKPIDIQIQALKRNARHYRLPMGQMSDFIYTSTDDLKKATQRIEKLSTEHSHPYVMFFFVSSVVSKKAFTIDDEGYEQTYQVESGIEQFRKGESVSAPYFIAATFGKKEKGEPCRFMKAIAIPILSLDRLFPVANSYERDLAERMVGLQVWWKKQGVSTTIEKPLFYQKVGLENIRPDFSIHSGNKQLILDVWSNQTPEYQNKKEELLPLLQELGDVVTIDACKYFLEDDYAGSMDKILKLVSAKILN